MKSKKLTYLDFAILDSVHRHGQLQDTRMSRKLHCPRTLLLNRLRFLLDAGYLSEATNGYTLTDLGYAKHITLPPVEMSAEVSVYGQEYFDWTALYVPKSGWFT